MIELIGYWRPVSFDPYWVNPNDKAFSYPDPNDLIDPSFYQDKVKIIHYLQTGIVINSYRGFSSCRICGQSRGSKEKSDGYFYWPDQLEHYVEHNVILPKKFIILSDPPRKEIPPISDGGCILWDDENLSQDFWNAWSRPYRKPPPVPISAEEFLRRNPR